MKIQISCSASKLSEATRKLIQKANWFVYSGPKIVLDQHHKEYNMDVLKKDKFGIIPKKVGYYLIHEDDPSIKFGITKAEYSNLIARSVPFYEKIKGVSVLSTRNLKTLVFTMRNAEKLLSTFDSATLATLAKIRNVDGKNKKEIIKAIVRADKSTKKPMAAAPIKAPKNANTKQSAKDVSPMGGKITVNVADLNENTEVSVMIQDELVKATIVEPPLGDSVRVMPKSGKGKGIAIRVQLSDIKRIIPKKVKALTANQKEQAAYDRLHEQTGAGAVIRIQGQDYVVVCGREQKRSSRTRFQNELSLVPINESNRLMWYKVKNLSLLFDKMVDKVSYKKYKEYLDIYNKRKSELNEKSEVSRSISNDKLKELGVKVGDSVNYRFSNGLYSVKVLDIDRNKGTIAVQGSGQKKRWLPAKNIEYVKRGDSVIDIN